MRLTLNDLREKEVINLNDGTCFGYAGDVLIDTETKSVLALVIKGRARLFGLLGREDDIMISWEKIDTIGTDVVLVKIGPDYVPKKQQKKSSFMEAISNFFNNF